MIDFTRKINSFLIDWKNSNNRKPLIIRGARQVGKTTLINNFSKNYTHFVDLNLERKRDFQYFEKYDEAKLILEDILLRREIPLSELKSTLLFIDEIQESPEAIHLLRYFYEDIPDLHIIAAGSLLEFSLSEVKSFPVGRVQYLYMYPLNFEEYLNAVGANLLAKELSQVPIKPTAHDAFLENFNTYAIVGGMPEVVALYKERNNLSDLLPVYGSIWTTYKSDIEKYGKNSTEKRILRHILESGPLDLDKRVKFQNFGNSNYRSREVSEAMRSLDLAKVIRLIYPTTDTETPVKSDLKKSPRLQFLDTGIVNYSLKIQSELLGVKDLSSAFKGALIPHLVTQELISLSSLTDDKPNFWVREKTQSSAEIDIVFPYKQFLLPIEIKSGKTGSLKSLHQFIEMVDHPYAIRIYAGEFKIQETSTPKGKPYYLMNLPYYLGTKIPEYVDYFISNYES